MKNRERKLSGNVTRGNIFSVINKHIGGALRFFRETTIC